MVVGSTGWGGGGSCTARMAPHSWSYRDLEGATTCGLPSLGGGLSKREALSFLPFFSFFFFLKQIQKQPVWDLQDRRALREAMASVTLDGRQCPKLDGTEGGKGERSAGQSEQTRHGRSCQPLCL